MKLMMWLTDQRGQITKTQKNGKMVDVLKTMVGCVCEKETTKKIMNINREKLNTKHKNNKNQRMTVYVVRVTQNTRENEK